MTAKNTFILACKCKVIESGILDEEELLHLEP